jgi:hypothetical protein
MRRLFLIVMLAFTECNWSDLDAEFLAAVPERADLHVVAPSESQQSQPLSSDLGQRQDGLHSAQFENLESTASALNGFLDGITGGLDAVRQMPPSQRSADARVWGPFPDTGNPGFEFHVVIVRGPDVFNYAVEWHHQNSDENYTAIVTGGFKGQRASQGEGQIILHAEDARSLGLKCVPDSAGHPNNCDVRTSTVTYSHGQDAQGQGELDVWLVVANLGYPDRSYQHARRDDGSGAMAYQFLTTDDPPASFQVDANWRGDRAGNIVAVASSSLGAAHYQECWDANLEQVYWAQDFADQSCAVAPCKPPMPGTGDCGKCTPEVQCL